MKLVHPHRHIALGQSPPTRRRGLKRINIDILAVDQRVASHAEAWIETTTSSASAGLSQVASHAEAWIETRF